MTLDEIAAAIVDEKSQFKKELRAAVVRARKLGELLLQAKEQLPHGDFLPWVSKKTKLSYTWAATYMAIAKGWDKVEKYGCDISVRQAEDVARGRPMKERSGDASVSVGRLLHTLEERIGDIVLEHPEVADIVDAIHQWRERLAQIGQLQKKRGAKSQKAKELVLSPRQLAQQRRAVV